MFPRVKGPACRRAVALAAAACLLTAGPATAASGTDDGDDDGRGRDRGPRTTGLIGWPDYAIDCFYVRGGTDHRGRRIHCVDAWESRGRFGHGGPVLR